MTSQQIIKRIDLYYSQGIAAITMECGLTQKMPIRSFEACEFTSKLKPGDQVTYQSFGSFTSTPRPFFPAQK